MLYGAGNISFCTKGLVNGIRGEELLHPGCIAEFELTADSNFAEARCLESGIRQVAAGQLTEETYTLSVTQEFNDWTSIQLAYDELAQVSSNVVLPVVKVASVPASPFTIVDTEITAANAASVKVYLSQRGFPGNRTYMKVVGVAPTAPDEVQVDGATNSLIFDSALEGAVVTYVFDKTYTSVESIGLESNADTYGTMQFSGLAYGTEFPNQMLIVIPQIQRISVPSLNVNGDVTTLTTEYRATVPSGSRKPYRLFDLSTAVV